MDPITNCVTISGKGGSTVLQSPDKTDTEKKTSIFSSCPLLNLKFPVEGGKDLIQGVTWALTPEFRSERVPSNKSRPFADQQNPVCKCINVLHVMSGKENCGFWILQLSDKIPDCQL